MNKYEKVNRLNDKEFKRVVGVKKEVFEKMIKVYKAKREEIKSEFGVGGRKPKLIDEDKVLMMLEYYREYRTFLHMSVDYGVSESTTQRVVSEVETILIKSGEFSLPSKKALYGDNIELDFVVVDVTEMPIQRPKKSKN